MKYTHLLTATSLVAAFSLAACQPATSEKAEETAQTDAAAPSGYMVATANDHATQAGAQVLEAGGSAVDAAVAILSVLSLVEPQSSGLGGGAFMVHYDAAGKSLSVFDGRERAPQSATKDMFLTEDGERMAYLDAKHSGLSTGVPSAVAMLNMAHSEYGDLPWKDLFGYAHTLAVDGFEVSPRMNGMIEWFGKYLPSKPGEGPLEGYNYLHADGKPLPVGYLLKNPEYAATLDIIAADPGAFYTGSIAEEIVAQVNAEPRAGGMTTADLAAYEPQKTEALCMPYKGKQICGPKPPSSWVAVAAIMGTLAQKPFEDGGATNPANWQRFVNAQRLSYADRDHYIGDPEFVDVPVSGLMHPDYLAERAALMDTDKVVAPDYGDPWAYNDTETAQVLGRDATNDIFGTTHFVVVDKAGNVVSMTATVESIFGSGRMAGGMFLNNQLTDFSFQYEDQEGNPIANAVAPGKRPRSSMSPTIMLDEAGDFYLATGSPGGSNIIAYTSKSLLGVLEWGLSPQDAVALPNIVARGDTVRVEANTGSEALIAALEAAGYTVDGSRGENSGLSMVRRLPDGSLEGGVDPRREGTVAQSD